MSADNHSEKYDSKRNTKGRREVKPYLRHLFFLAFIVFALNKFYLRPWVLERELPKIAVVLVNSLPNLIEAIMATILLLGVTTLLRLRLQQRPVWLKDSTLLLLVSAIVGCYVIAQELNFHRLGGSNVYDPYDVFASLLGLVIINRVINKYGFME